MEICLRYVLSDKKLQISMTSMIPTLVNIVCLYMHVKTPRRIYIKLLTIVLSWKDRMMEELLSEALFLYCLNYLQ